jgi:hypothetical protein
VLVPCLTLASLLLSCNAASASSVVLSTLSQPLGGSAVDFTNLSSGDYKVSITTNGQVSFHYFDGQDTAAQIATLQVTANSASPLGYATTSTEYIATATVTLQNPAAGDASSYTSQFRFNSSTLPSIFFDNMSFDSTALTPGAKQLAFQGDGVSLEGKNVTGSAFDFSGLSRGTLNIEPTSLVAGIPDYSGSNFAPPPTVFQGSQFSDFANGSDFGSVDNPEPGTVFMMGGALLAGIAAIRLMKKTA